MSFKEIQPHPNFARIEEEILKFWDKNEIFQKSLAKNSQDKKFVFYEGPPTANGKPGIHHTLARVFKDLMPRFKTMKGFYVKRRAGWDTHGLPVEIEVEKELGLKNKKEIEEYGIAKFNQRCRQSVWRYKKEWEDLTKRLAFWIDLENPYITYENGYIEKVWQILKKIWDKNLIYAGFKVVPYCPRCGTTLSSHEVAQGYRNIQEETIYLKIALKNEKNKYFLVWTTTPWTLPANIALAVSQDIDYVEAEQDGKIYILAKECLKILPTGKILREFKGRALVGKSYEPLYPASDFTKIDFDKDYKVWDASFVSAQDGTGIVHIAPAFGEDDINLQKEKMFSMPITVDENGLVLSEIGQGKFVKEADEDIKNDLAKRGLLFKKENFRHDYPFCWRCESILIYCAKSSWFIKMSEFQDKLLENSEQINWIPSYIKKGRFGQWLLEAKDWALSRERYWGTPLPIWQCQIGKTQNSKLSFESEPEGSSLRVEDKTQNNCNNTIVIGSIAELQKLSTKPIDREKIDLHKPYIDSVVLKCEKCGDKMRRVPEVIDVWFDSGSMPFASGEYPDFYPADYISEAVDQTRGWFYTLLAISTLLDKGAPYKNVICLAHVLDEHGKKMSKSRGNAIDPWAVINQYGADSLRWYFLTVNHPGEPKRLSEKSVEQAGRQFILLLWNVYSFFVTYANMDNWDARKLTESENILDQWILSKLNILNQTVGDNLEKYDIVTAARQIQSFTNDLSTWYLRRSRKRRDSEFYSTLYNVLLTLAKIIAPFVPYVAEAIYQNLRLETDPESIHLCDWPKIGDINQEILKNMPTVRNLAEKGLALRAEKGIRLRQPLAKLTIDVKLDNEYKDILKDELNVSEILEGKEIVLDTKITSELKSEGMFRDIVRLIQDRRKQAGLLPGQKVHLYYKGDPMLEKMMIEFKMKIEKSTNTKIGKTFSKELSKECILDGQKIWLGLKK